MNKGKEQSFETMWRGVIFELCNIDSAKDFQRIESEAAAGQLTKETFAMKMVECEFRAAEKTRAFYIHVFLPWAKEQRAPTDPKAWYLSSRSDSRENLILSHVDKRGGYWRHYEHWYDSIPLSALVKKGENEKAIELASKLKEQATTNEENVAIFSNRALPTGTRGNTARRLPTSRRSFGSTRRNPMPIVLVASPTGARGNTTRRLPTTPRPFG